MSANAEYSFTLEDEVIVYEESQRLYDALDKLDPVERDVLLKFYLHEDSLLEIACDGDNSYAHYRNIKDKALKKLKKYI